MSSQQSEEQVLEALNRGEGAKVVAEMSMHPAASELARAHVFRFGAVLIYQAKLLAFRRGDDVVMRNHINEALEKLNAEKESSWVQAMLLTFGSAFFGAGVQGFITEVSNNRPTWIITYGALTIAGMLLVSLGFILMVRRR